MPPIANPVEARTASASGRVRASPITPAAAFSFTRLRPETKSRYGAPLALPAKTSDLTICPTSQPHAAAASSAVRVDCGMARMAIARPSRSAASRTLSALGAEPAWCPRRRSLAQLRHAEAADGAVGLEPVQLGLERKAALAALDQIEVIAGAVHERAAAGRRGGRADHRHLGLRPHEPGERADMVVAVDHE